MEPATETGELNGQIKFPHICIPNFFHFGLGCAVKFQASSPAQMNLTVYATRARCVVKFRYVGAAAT